MPSTRLQGGHIGRTVGLEIQSNIFLRELECNQENASRKEALSIEPPSESKRVYSMLPALSCREVRSRMEWIIAATR